MGLISEQQLSEIKSRGDIVTLIGEFIPLKRAGRNWKGHCPFHEEKTPSFMVSAEKQIYHCFGCGEGGNVFNFIMKFEGLSFVEAAEKLAARYGIHLVHEARTEDVVVQRGEKELLSKVNRMAARYFYQTLQEPVSGAKGREYLQARGVLPETVKKFGLGLSLPSFQGLVPFLESQKVPLALAEKLGLVRKGEGGRYYDFFRDRLIFPIISPGRQVIGFGGRTLANDPDQAKYINSVDSPLYNKGESVFGLNLAKTAIRQKNEVILVEGYLDQIMLFQNGFENVVAPLGTALTEGQIKILARFSDHFTLLFDGDAAGFKARERALPLFLKMGIPVKTVPLPLAEDPDSFVRKEGPEALAAKLAQAVPLLDFLIEKVALETERSPQAKSVAVKGLLPYLALISGEVEKGLSLQKLASLFQVEENLILKELHALPKKGATFTPPLADEAMVVGEGSFPGRLPALLKSLSPLERTLFELVLSGHPVPPSFWRVVEESDFSSFELQELWRQIRMIGEKEGIVLIATLLNQLQDERLRRWAVSLAMENLLSGEDLPKAFQDCEKEIRRRSFKKELAVLTQEIRLAEEKRDSKRLSELMAQKNKLLQETVLIGEDRVIYSGVRA
ncbi:MAG: DNA primase [Deltaproteobacteria bacterium]|nr:DNA primase [Deltaproteobacteria bacterium]